MSKIDIQNISKKKKSIVEKLNRDFYYYSSETENSLFVGSYGRGTKIIYSDIDLIFELPPCMYYSYNRYKSNGQTALLQEVRKSLLSRFPNTFIRADGQIISVRFSDNTKIELLPAFLELDESHTFADANYGGRWKTTNPKSEIYLFNEKNAAWNGNLKFLCKMARAWKINQNVNISGILLDTLVYNYLLKNRLRFCTFTKFDYLSYEFFSFLALQNYKQTFWFIPGSNQKAYRYGNFENKAQLSMSLAYNAIQSYKSNNYKNANAYWRKIYGYKFPSY